MAEEGYGLQVSLRSGDDLFNARGADADELVAILQGLLDAAEDNELAEWVVKTFSVGSTKKRASSNGSSKRTSSSRSSGSRSSGDDEPSAAQKKYAKILGIKGYSRMSKSELSEAIDEAKEAQEDEDDDED